MSEQQDMTAEQKQTWTVQITDEDDRRIRILDPEGNERFAGTKMLAIAHFALALKELDELRTDHQRQGEIIARLEARLAKIHATAQTIVRCDYPKHPRDHDGLLEIYAESALQPQREGE